MAGKLAEKIKWRNPNRLTLTAEELCLFQKVGVVRGRKQGFVDREIGGKIIRHHGIIRRIEESGLVTTPTGRRVISTKSQMVFEVFRKEDTDFIAEPRRRTKHFWAA